MVGNNFSTTSNGCPFYDEGDSGWGAHCNVTNNDCDKEKCPFNEWYSSFKYGVFQDNDGSVRVVTADDE